MFDAKQNQNIHKTHSASDPFNASKFHFFPLPLRINKTTKKNVNEEKKKHKKIIEWSHSKQQISKLAVDVYVRLCVRRLIMVY